MKVYVIKNDKGQYQTPDRGLIYPIWLADIFNDYDVAKYYCRSDCNVVECELIEKNELSEHDKQVKKEVCQEIRKKVLEYFNVKNEKEYENSLSLLDALFTADVVFEILDKIQGGEEWKD